MEKQKKNRKKFKDTKLFQTIKKFAPEVLDKATDIAATVFPPLGIVNNIVDTGIDLLKAKGDPEAMKAVLELKEQKAEYTEEHIEYERIMAADRASARRREINIAKLGKIDFMLYLTGMVALGCFVAVVYVMLSGQLPENAIVHQIIGLLEGMVIAIVSYYFGSSKNSNNQDKK
jgi:hypothetical protein